MVFHASHAASGAKESQATLCYIGNSSGICWETKMKEGDRMEHKDDVLMDGNYQRKIQIERRGQIYGNK